MPRPGDSPNEPKSLSHKSRNNDERDKVDEQAWVITFFCGLKFYHIDCIQNL